MPSNPLRASFDQIEKGPGVWKWLHYFDIYHRHLAKFIDQEVTVAEIGVYSGGSLGMWQRYFGNRCHLHGVDVQEACKVYECERTTIHIGDQADRAFWKRFRERVPKLNVLIDDGGHTPEQQRITLEEMLPHLSLGGVYICEDIHGLNNPFSAFVHNLANHLNAFVPVQQQSQLATHATQFQSLIHSFHFYPYLVVIEKAMIPCDQFVAPKHGTEWQPFL